MSVKRPGPDHIGFHVENLDAFKARVAEVAGMNPYLAGLPLGGSPESDVRKRFFAARRAANGRCPIPTGTGSISPTIELAIALGEVAYAIGKQNDLASPKTYSLLRD